MRSSLFGVTSALLTAGGILALQPVLTLQGVARRRRIPMPRFTFRGGPFRIKGPSSTRDFGAAPSTPKSSSAIESTRKSARSWLQRDPVPSRRVVAVAARPLRRSTSSCT